ncbi:bacillithiol biosynthesis cysteine-adding enzyme BshC [Tenacibaculum finnmarkense]|uniref:bacillithiol biosynthesis cysteine-adding enzyme BshC n=1 Tax=Tenacibaculum finnmarkense TaxID=2781243 RepID=UPI00187B9357|nr:bacillithiol biosynthesis cysteine-adding enzyme BshC [Tenacibaculum finnmarkense]MBE7660932.1 bacillithiol biosynthesis cysteine-adding enzyme BshC [Tenacibaculum finnmarkense genomovar finnmarkense]MCG8252608.1 bacillithiol biosynthesis cysteine-adding enzyme BshC [Tenacibaculum finnmarkense genomovar finnmarkense]MCG8816158.1 bacillithiol biosynthesis cysteine-adding enzyme BshC [Tenacibaculum finnmarkense]MCG8821088.1 bacillithiol biosynthesis cysteine-adding enzyme BshC [Tenacibaculum f
MKVTNIPFKKTGFFSKTMLDYLEESAEITPFYDNFSSLEGFEKQIATKKAHFSKDTRKTLVTALEKQYLKVTTTASTAQNIASLSSENTFTVTTGHQLNLFTGPLYFLYKIITAINLAEELTAKYPKQNFVPIYWMATEDHDFEEINYFNFKGKKVQWNSDQTGAVGRFSTQGLAEVLVVFSEHLGASKNAVFLKELFEKAYVKHANLADATRYIANELFGEYGLVIIDADEKSLKKVFIPFIENELKSQTSYKKVSETIKDFGKNYKIQVNPREINLFYLTDKIRERIVFENDIYKVNNTDISWALNDLLEEVAQFPDRFSPNVIMRPLYQEVILPNLCYLGGGGELAYWLELKSYFEAVKVPFPILLLRNSAQIISEKQATKLTKLTISLEDIFLKQRELLKKKVLEISEEKIDFTEQKEFLKQQFVTLRALAEKTDVSFVGAVNAQEKKQLNGLESLEKRWLRAEKRRHKNFVDRIVFLQNEILPNGSLEERQRNFSEYYLAHGNILIKELKKGLKPLQLEFTVLIF